MVSFTDAEEFFPVDTKIRVISNGETFVGIVKKFSAPSTIVLRLKTDNGESKFAMLDCEKIESISYAEENSPEPPPLKQTEPDQSQILTEVDEVQHDSLATKKTGTLTFFNLKEHYGFIDYNIRFALTHVDDKNLKAALNSGGLWRKNIKVEYKLINGSAENVTLRQGETLPDETYKGSLLYYNAYTDYGQVQDSASSRHYGFKFSAVLDNRLRRYLQDGSNIHNLPVQFTLKLHSNGKEVVRHLGLSAKENSAPFDGYSPTPQSLYDKDKAESFRRGNRYFATKNYRQAVSCFEDSILDDNFFEKSLNNLIFIYTANYGEDINEQVEKGLQLLKRYENRLAQSVITKYRIHLLDRAKPKRTDELIAELKKAIELPDQPVQRRLHYRLQLAGLYRLKNDPADALQCYEDWFNEKNLNRGSLGSQMDFIEFKVRQNMAICLSLLGEKERAKEIANELLKINPNDQTAQNILNDQLQMPTADSADLLELTDSIDAANLAGFDIDFLEDDDLSPLSPYVQYKLDEISLKTSATTYRRLLKGRFDQNFEDDDFTGTPEQASGIINEILNNLKSSGDDKRRDAWAFAAKLVSKAGNSFDRDRCEKNKIGPLWERVYAAQFMGYAGDWELRRQLDCNLDTARFFYNEEMAIMPKGKGNARGYFVKMLASFFLKPDALAKLDPGGKTSHKDAHLLFAKNFSQCSEPKRLLVTTFLLTSEMEKFTVEFLNKLAADSLWRQEAEKLFTVLLSEEISLSEENFKEYWQRAKTAYIKAVEKFSETLMSAAQNCDNADDNSAEKIDEMLEQGLLAQTDAARLKRYRALLSTMRKIADKFTFEEKEDDFIKVIENSDELIKDICNKPTKLSFEKLLKAFEHLRQKAETALKKLYESSVPSLTIKPNIIGSEQFSVIVENKENCQTAVNLKVDVETINGNIELKVAGKRPTAVRGGSASEFLYDVVLNDEEKNRGYFEVSIRVSYSYRIAKGETTDTSIERHENISLLNREDYEEIVNVYSSLAEGNSVPTESNLFYGRDEDINKIVEMLQLPNGSLLKHRGIIMFGQKRAGKTSIMNHLKQKIRDAYGQDAYVIVDVGSVGLLHQSFAAFLSKIISRLENTLRKDHKELFKFLREREVNFAYREIEKDDTSEASRIGIFDRTLETILDTIREFAQSEDKFIPLFLIDEFTYFYKWIKDGIIDDDFMKFWKAFLENNPVCAIIIGMDHMPQFVNEYKNEFACMTSFPVHFLKEQYTKDLADIPIRLKDGSSRYRDKPGQDALSYIHQLTAGSAYLTVIFCKAFVEYLNERKTTFVTRTVIDNFVKEVLLGTHPVLQETMFDPQLQDPGKFSVEEQAATYVDNKAVLTCIALKADGHRHELSRDKIDCFDKLSVKTPEHRDAIVERLKNRNVLTQNGDYYRIEIELLRMWLLREIGKDF